jgi:hypothetical protein
VQSKWYTSGTCKYNERKGILKLEHHYILAYIYVVIYVNKHGLALLVLIYRNEISSPIILKQHRSYCSYTVDIIIQSRIFQREVAIEEWIFNTGVCIKLFSFLYSPKMIPKCYRIFPWCFTEKRHGCKSPPPNEHMTFLVNKIDMWGFPKYDVITYLEACGAQSRSPSMPVRRLGVGIALEKSNWFTLDFQRKFYACSAIVTKYKQRI